MLNLCKKDTKWCVVAPALFALIYMSSYEEGLERVVVGGAPVTKHKIANSLLLYNSKIFINSLQNNVTRKQGN